MTLNYSLTLVHKLGGDNVIVLSPPMLLDFNDFTFGPHTFKLLEITTQRLDSRQTLFKQISLIIYEDFLELTNEGFLL